MEYVETYRDHRIMTEFNGCCDTFLFVPANRGQHGAYAHAGSLEQARHLIDNVLRLMALEYQQHDMTCPREPFVGQRFASWEHYGDQEITIELVEEEVAVGRLENGGLQIYVNGQPTGHVGGVGKRAAEFLQAARRMESAWDWLAAQASQEA